MIGTAFQRPVKMGLADIAPGANRIRKDIKPDHQLAILPLTQGPPRKSGRRTPFN